MISIATLKDAKAEQVFNQVAAHLLKQNKRSITTDDQGFVNCQYRSPEGLMCAAGCLMSEEEYHPSFENTSYDGLTFEESGPTSKLKHVKLIQELQALHDGYGPEDWKNELKAIARRKRWKWIHGEAA